MSDSWSDSSSMSILPCVRTAKALVRLRGCAGSPEPSLVAYVISTIISWAGSNYHNMGSHLMFPSGNKIQHWWIIEENGWLHVHQEFVTETLQHSKQGGTVNQYTLLTIHSITLYFQILHEWSFHMKWEPLASFVNCIWNDHKCGVIV